MRDLEDEEPFMNLHGSTVDVTISPRLFVINGELLPSRCLLKRMILRQPKS